MTTIDEEYQKHTAAGRHPASASVHWRIGNASVSTEELQAWQLGPAGISQWLPAAALPAARG